MSNIKEIWEKIEKSPHHGIDVFLPALRSKNSCGIGEYFDLLPLIDWCKEVGFDVIQLLPLNDSGRDPSPYNAISSHALNPLLLSLHALPYKKNELSAFVHLNALQHTDYQTVYSKKMEWLYSYFKQTKELWNKDANFSQFMKENLWLEGYSYFKSIKAKMEGKAWEEWGPEYPPESHVLEEINFYNLLQYLCFLQLKEVKKHAAALKIFLMGDIPILISRDSADVWQKRDIFDLTLSAGAPPDQYSKEGQYWSFPIFRWNVLEKQNYSWWKDRIGYAANFYDIYRIDHVVGFFRIWAIPLHQPSSKGKFLPEDESLWIPQGKQILQMMIGSSNMLPIAEDLGTVPPVVRVCLQELGICGTKVMHWERYWLKDKSYIPINEYLPLSMTCVSTHDSEPLALWWKNNPDEAKLYAESKNWSYAPQITHEQKLSILKDSNHTTSLFHINLLQEYLSCNPELAWGTPEQERINIPGTVLPTNWTYRYKPTVEEIVSHPELKDLIKECTN